MSEFDVDKMEKYLTTKYVGRNVVYKETTQSTMDDARELVKTGEPDGSAVLAEIQTKGRGQDGHVWYSQDRGNIYVTFIFRKSISLQNRVGIQDLEFVASCAVLAAILEVGVTSAMLKWKNDIWCCGRKVCGALVESVPITGDANLAAFLVGIGVNVNSDSRRHPKLKDIATSVRTELRGQVVDREKLFANICNHLEICLETDRLLMFRSVDDYQLFRCGSVVNVHNFIDYKLLYSGTIQKVIEDDWRCVIKDLKGEDQIVGDGISLRPKPQETVLLLTEDSGKDWEINYQYLQSLVDTSYFSVKTTNREDLKKGSWVDNTTVLVIDGHSSGDVLNDQRIQQFVYGGGSVMVLGLDGAEYITSWIKGLEISPLPIKQNSLFLINFEDSRADVKTFFNYQSRPLYQIKQSGEPMKSLATTEAGETVAAIVNCGRGEIVIVTFDLYNMYSDLNQSSNISEDEISAITNTFFHSDQFCIFLLKLLTPRKR